MIIPNKMEEGEGKQSNGMLGSCTPMLVLGLLSLILTHFHSSKALHSDSNIPGSQEPKMNDDLWCVPAQDPALASLKSTFIRCGTKPIFLVLGVDV